MNEKNTIDPLRRHWVYKVLQEHKSILLNCFFYSNPNEMFNLEVSEFDVGEIQQTIINGLSNGFLFLTNEEGERIAFAPDKIKECRYYKPSKGNDDSCSNPTFLNIESSVQDIPEKKRE